MRTKSKLPAKSDRQSLCHPYMLMRLPSNMQLLFVILHPINLQAAGGFVVEEQ